MKNRSIIQGLLATLEAEKGCHWLRPKCRQPIIIKPSTSGLGAHRNQQANFTHLTVPDFVERRTSQVFPNSPLAKSRFIN